MPASSPCGEPDTVNRSGSISGAASLPNSVTTRRRIRPEVRRVLACPAPCRVAR